MWSCSSGSVAVYTTTTEKECNNNNDNSRRLLLWPASCLTQTNMQNAKRILMTYSVWKTTDIDPNCWNQSTASQHWPSHSVASSWGMLLMMTLIFYSFEFVLLFGRLADTQDYVHESPRTLEEAGCRWSCCLHCGLLTLYLIDLTGLLCLFGSVNSGTSLWISVIVPM